MHTIGLSLLILSAVDILIATETEIISINEGEIFELKCSTNLQYPVVWYFRRSDGTHEIFLGGEISMTFKNMFLLTGNQSIGEYNLLISSADGRYDGNYKCIDDEGLGSALLSIQLNIIASTSTSYNFILPLAEHAPDPENYEAPKAAASSSRNNMHSNSIANPGVVSAIVLSVIIVVAIIIIIAIFSILKLRPKSKGKNDANCHKDAEAQLPPSIKIPDSFANPALVKEKAVESDAEKSNSLNPQTGRRHVIVSQSSDSSEAQLLPADNEEHV